ncbi:hypothetical protein F383_21340 [Gossypium arboreum]|uniref:Uncharacterized protein n=1 Tax=Gossypium arboreum TaxID=29729 RepID=A0A0B0MN76_GOSAR|nr:hypothetical protein F383_21340 [Gossypium arboreum]
MVVDKLLQHPIREITSDRLSSTI